MADGTVKVTSADIRAALKLRYPAQSHALLFEVAPTTGGGTRYADAVAVGLWASHGHAIEGIEVKVSRSDFLNEMKQPEKSQPVFQYCNRWWLACPKDMVKPEELPDTWGLLELCGDSLRQKVKAPKLTPEPITIGFLGALVRRHAGLDEEMAKQALATRMVDFERRTREEYERKANDRASHRVCAAEEAMALIDKIKTETGFDLSTYEYRGDNFLAAVKLSLALGGNYRGIAEVRRCMEAAMQAIDASGLVAARPTPEGAE